MDKFRCGRRGPFDPNSPFAHDQEEHGDHWRADGTCSYCGSLSGDAFIKHLKEGGEVTPTDKGYKAYVHGSFTQTYRNCTSATCKEGPDACTHWVTRPTDTAKFYFQHLDDAQRHEFIQLYNDRKMKVGYPGHFYVLPYFCRSAPKEG